MQTHFPPLRVAASWQALGNGYRIYNPALMRFHGPDAWSPFGRGGLNAYAYAADDPVNHLDPSGHFVIHVPQLLVLIGISVASLGAAGIAVNTANDTQRVLSSVASVLAGIGALAMGRHMYRKGRTRSPARVATTAKAKRSISPASQPVVPDRVTPTQVGPHDPSRRSTWPEALPVHKSRQEGASALQPPGVAFDPGFAPYGSSRPATRAPAHRGRETGGIQAVYAIRSQMY